MRIPAFLKTILAGSLSTIVLSVSGQLAASAQKVTEPPVTNKEWTQAYQPFRIAGNLYYVGTYELASYLVTTPQGNILINTGVASSFETIRDNIKALGFKLTDIKILLTTQVHYDHVGAMAAMKKATGAKMMVDAADSGVLADGGLSDYELKSKGVMFRGVRADRVLHDHDTISLGGMQLVLLHHPGHTRGSCSYLFDVKDEQRSYRVLIANMPTIISERKFSDISDYPGIAKDFAYTLGDLKKQTFDIWLASHASQFDFHKKHHPGDAYNPMAFADRKGYDEELNELKSAYDKKMAQE